uniref:Dynein light chain Tctex-type 1 n=1 Tax=Naja naja TaxID=35670 RepID=A0A8C6V3G3_NAJNA
MDELQSAEETAFVVDEVSNIIKEAIEGTIGGNAYLHSKVNQWTTTVVEQILSHLTKLGKPFKYVVTCVIMQKMVLDFTLQTLASGTMPLMEPAL